MVSPNAEQTRWREAVRELGSVISGGPAVIHHMYGRTASFNKVHVGHWALLPLTDEEHKYRHQHGKKAFSEKWAHEKDLFLTVCERFDERPFDDATFSAIMMYRK